MGVVASDGRFEGKTETRGDCQNLSISVSESVILGESRVTEEVTIPLKAAENARFSSKRTADFGHLGFWHSECDSRHELVIQPNSQTETRTISMRKQKCFSLIELLIVVAIILIIAAIAIPNLLRARIAAQESSAVGSVRTIVTAQISYNTAYPTIGFAAALTNLGTGGSVTACPGAASNTACLIDGLLAAGTKSGYTFGVLSTGGPNPTTNFNVWANPLTAGTTGVRTFCAATDGVVRYVPSTPQSSCAGTEMPLQ